MHLNFQSKTPSIQLFKIDPDFFILLIIYQNILYLLLFFHFPLNLGPSDVLQKFFVFLSQRFFLLTPKLLGSVNILQEIGF